MVNLARSEPGMAVLPSELDANAWLLNCLSGTVDLKTGAQRPHAREDLITRVVEVPYDPAATCPLWLKTLDRILDGRTELIRYFQKAIGYSCTGDTREQCLFVFWGSGSNGKSTILTTAVTLLGEYALSTRPETLMVKRGDSIPNDVAQLKGRRFVIAVEADPGQRLAESLVKSMTGSDVISARFMRAEFFQFEPTFKIFLATNHRPAIRGTDWAVWRRIRLVPFTVTIADDQQDRQLADKLRAELPGILTWAVEGCLAWRREGLGVPAAVRAATAQYRADMDVLGEFLLEHCVLDPAGRIAARELYTEYEAWAHRAGERHPLKEKTFSLRLTDRGLTKKPTKAGKIWLGLRLRSPLDPTPGEVTDPPVTPAPGDGSARAVQPPIGTAQSSTVADGDASFGLIAHALPHGGLTGDTRHHPSPDTDPDGMDDAQETPF
jgi:putative DNA primase/helicase